MGVKRETEEEEEREGGGHEPGKCVPEPVPDRRGCVRADLPGEVAWEG